METASKILRKVALYRLDRKLTLSLNLLIQIINEGYLFRPLVDELSAFLKKFPRKVLFFRHIIQTQPKNQPKVLEQLGDFLLFLWGGETPAGKMENAEFFQALRRMRDHLDWKNILFFFSSNTIENCPIGYFTPDSLRSCWENKFFIFYFDGIFKFVNEFNGKDKFDRLLIEHPDMILELSLKEYQLNITCYQSTFNQL